MSNDKVSIALVLPDLLGTYGDFGNAVVLEKRMTWRGIPAEIVTVNFGEPVPDSCDIYVVGGGEDTAQTLAVRHLRDHPGMQRAAARGAVVLGVCAGIQIFGESFTRADQVTHPGLGLLDSTSHAGGSRAIGEVVATPADGLFEGLLTGFENHQGRTVLGPSARPLAHVKVGTGNDGSVEGAVQGRILCTYLHGPVLPRNPQLADLLIEWATGTKPAPLELEAVTRLRTERAKAAGVPA
ncbi:type 1 glutamine amidotransferase [Saccharothrix syringae]|uniref:Lipid II isoglutaminyl synthase (glutamine-hydrolyzing) subunit GatD n=1 Tax=Saccharothrix syringae TaxID=103733 RepID=A0A5Q0GTY6_SACSY|nr:glutamine amidotransferase [Saccharothrix syringae]QFZ17095.1 glutamine amidotransferase [Saccharothrix syringae]